MHVSYKPLTLSLLSALLVVFSGAGFANNADDIRFRVQKVGKLNINTGATTPASTADAKSSEAAPKTAALGPADLYQTYCFACHGTGVADAPVLGDKEAWQARIAKGEDTLLINAINGYNAMPPRGGTSLEDDKIEQIVTYIIENSQ